jgi:hypothetical protein
VNQKMDTGRLGVKGRLDASANSEALVLPRGTIAQRPTGPTGGMVRFNTNINQIEGWNGVAWGPIGSTGPTGTFDNSLVQVSSFTTAQRDSLSPSNGSLIYNSTVNRFQGYQAGAWINIDDGSLG